MAFPPHLAGVIAKILRAEEHFGTLHNEITRYLEACRDRAQLPTKIDPTKNTVRLAFEPIVEPSLLISMIIGDCIHNTRSSLDHLWKRLGGEDNFPLYGDVHSPNNWLKQKAKRLRAIPVAAHAIIDSLQPWFERENARFHPLAILNELSNIDKHEAIHLTRPRSKNTRIAFREKGSAVEIAVVHPPIIFHEQTELILTNVPDGARPGMDVNIKGTLFVSFKELGPWADEDVRLVLRRCLDFVKNSVIGPLAQFTQ